MSKVGIICFYQSNRDLKKENKMVFYKTVDVRDGVECVWVIWFYLRRRWIAFSQMWLCIIQLVLIHIYWKMKNGMVDLKNRSFLFISTIYHLTKKSHFHLLMVLNSPLMASIKLIDKWDGNLISSLISSHLSSHLIL